MTDGLDFSPLTSEERESAAQVATHEGEADATRPMLPPADAEPPEAAAARLFGARPAKSGLPDRGRSVGLLCLPLGLRRGPEGNPAFVLGSVSRAGAWRIGRTRVRSTISTSSLLTQTRLSSSPRAKRRPDAVARIFPRSACQTTSETDPHIASSEYVTEPLVSRRRERVVPGVHRRDPRAAERPQESGGAARAGGSCGPTWASPAHAGCSWRGCVVLISPARRFSRRR